MPSFPDLSHDADTEATDVGPAGPAASEYVLLHIKSEGLWRRRRRHRRNTVLAAVGLAIVAVPAIAVLPLGGGGEEEDLTVAGAPDAGTEPSVADEAPEDSVVTVPSSTPATAVPPSTVDTAPSVSVEEAPAATRPPATSVSPATAPPLQCRNLTDPSCGEFRWDPAPGPNEPLTAAFVDVPAAVAAGEPVTFFVAWSDPDATLTFDNFSPDGVGLGSSCVVERRYGPWTPPDPAAGSGELAYTHTFTAPGEYLVVVSLATGTCGEPYASERTVELPVTVT